MRALKLAGAAIAAVAVIIALLGAFGIPAGVLTSAIAERVERETGYKVAINGSSRIVLWPTVHITLSDIVLQAPTQREVNNRFTADSIEAETTLSSLWSGRPEITDLVIIKPVVNLPLQRERTRDNNPPAQSASPGNPSTMSVRHVGISGGTIVLANPRDRVEDRIETVNADVTVGADRSIVVTGNARARDKPVNFEIRAAAPPTQRQNAPTEFNIDAPGLLPAALKANAEVRLNGTVLMFSGVSGTLGDGGFTGWASVDFASNKPLVKCDLDFRRISIAATPSQPNAEAQPAGTNTWSNAPIDLKLLNYVDAQARISAAELMIGDGRFAPASIDASLTSGVVKGRLDNLGAYDGNANGELTIDASSDTPTYALRLDLNSVRALPVLKTLAGFDKLDGRMQARFDLHSQGTSERAIVAGLGGTALAAFQDGKIIGLNLAQMIRNLTTSPLSGWQESAELSTDLSQLSASFKIDRGLATTTDLDLVGPLVKMTGAGTVDLNTRQIGFRVEPQLVMTTEGQGRAGNPVGFGIPVMIEGPWADPRIYPEIQGIFDNPEAAYAKLKEMGKGLFGPGGAGLGGLSDFLGGRQDGNGTAQPKNDKSGKGGGEAEGSGTSQNNSLGGQLGETIGKLLQQGLSTLNQSNAKRGSQDSTQGSTQGRGTDQAAPPPSPPDPSQQDHNPAMNDILRQLFNR